MLVVALVNATAPASAISPSSAIAVPATPLVAAPYICKRGPAAREARRPSESIIAALSMTGCVFGRQPRPVIPPAAAAFSKVARSSRCSDPGSAVCTRMSTRPGARQAPLQSMTLSAFAVLPLICPDPRALITPSVIARWPLASKFCEGSIRRALVKRISVMAFPLASQPQQPALRPSPRGKPYGLQRPFPPVCGSDFSAHHRPSPSQFRHRDSSDLGA